MLDQAFEALKVYDWGTDPNVLQPINEAIIATYGDDTARGELETRLAALLSTDAPRDAKDFVCRKLMLIGSANSVPALAKLLPDAENSHMARYALERIPNAEAGQAMRDALPTIDNSLKIGVIASLGVRGDADSVPQLAGLLGDANVAVATAAARALGAMATADAAKALAENKPGSEKAQLAATDASFACAEKLLAEGKRGEALAVYKGFVGTDQPKQVRVAATRGMLACAGKE